MRNTGGADRDAEHGRVRSLILQAEIRCTARTGRGLFFSTLNRARSDGERIGNEFRRNAGGSIASGMSSAIRSRPKARHSASASSAEGHHLVRRGDGRDRAPAIPHAC